MHLGGGVGEEASFPPRVTPAAAISGPRYPGRAGPTAWPTHSCVCQTPEPREHSPGFLLRPSVLCGPSPLEAREVILASLAHVPSPENGRQDAPPIRAPDHLTLSRDPSLGTPLTMRSVSTRNSALPHLLCRF